MRRRALFQEWLPPLAVIVACVALWEATVVLLKVPEFVLPGPISVWSALLKWHEAIWFNSAQTLYTTLVGFALAVVGGMASGGGPGEWPSTACQRWR